MFDTIVHHKQPNYPQHVAVTEKRAPTDESVRLLAEMEAAARERVISTGRLDNNVANCEWLVMPQGLGTDRELIVRVKINGREERRSVTLGLDEADAAQVAAKVHAAVLDAVASVISVDAFAAAFNHVRRMR